MIESDEPSIITSPHFGEAARCEEQASVRAA
jgi:hypothetical protein